MSTLRDYETTVTLAGLEIPVTVEFEITTFGSSPSGYGFDGSYDPGESDEFHITRVLTESGRDLAPMLGEMRETISVVAYNEQRPAGGDPLLAILAPYRTRLEVSGPTALDRLEDEICDDSDLLAPPDDSFDDYDPRDWA